MKISKIIFLSLVGVIALIIIVGAIDIRINGTKGPVSAFGNKNKIAIPSVTVLCLNSSKGFSIVEGDSSCIEVRYSKDSLAPKLNYDIKGDTLIFTNIDLSRRHITCTIRVNAKLDKFYLKNSNLIFGTVPSVPNRKSLVFDLDQSTVNFNQNKDPRFTVSSMNFTARNKSRFFAYAFKVDSINITLQNSQANLYIDMGNIEGGITDESRLNCRPAREISLKRDASSKIQIY